MSNPKYVNPMKHRVTVTGIERIPEFIAQCEVVPTSASEVPHWYWRGDRFFDDRTPRRWSYHHFVTPLPMTTEVTIRPTCQPDPMRPDDLCVSPGHLHRQLSSWSKNRRLTDEQVRVIRHRYITEPKASLSKLARACGITPTAVNHIITGRTAKWAPPCEHVVDMAADLIPDYPESLEIETEPEHNWLDDCVPEILESLIAEKVLVQVFDPALPAVQCVTTGILHGLFQKRAGLPVTGQLGNKHFTQWLIANGYEVCHSNGSRVHGLIFDERAQQLTPDTSIA